MCGVVCSFLLYYDDSGRSANNANKPPTSSKTHIRNRPLRPAFDIACPVHNRGEDEIMTNDEIVERAKRLYAIIVNRELGDDEDSVCKRVCIVRELEAITHKDFRNTAEFHREVGAYLARKSRIKETDGGRLRRARKQAKLTIKVLAAELGVTKRTIIRWEKNDGPPLSTRAVEWLNRQNISTGEKVTLVSERV